MFNSNNFAGSGAKICILPSAVLVDEHFWKGEMSDEQQVIKFWWITMRMHEFLKGIFNVDVDNAEM